jgi:protein TonB
VGDRLSSTLFVAGLFHGIVILGVTFTATPVADTETIPTLRVTLVRDDDAAAPPEEADYLAQRSRTGSAATSVADRPTTTLSARDPFTNAGDPRGADRMDGTPREPVPSANRLVTRNPSTVQIDAMPERTDEPAEIPLIAANAISRVADQTVALEIDLQAAAPAAEPRDGAAGPTTRESALAQYLDAWRNRVERIGTENFPTEAREQGYRNNPTLEVVIAADGRIDAIVVRRSSGNVALDQAALTILRSAAPFEPLPQIIRAEYEVLRFAYEWEFSEGGLSSVSEP